MLQATKRFGIDLQPGDSDLRPIAVERFQLDDGSEEFQKVFADGTRSERLRPDQLDDESRCLADRPPSPRARAPPRSRKRKSISQRSAHAQNSRKRQRNLAKTSANLGYAPSTKSNRVKTLREFDSADKARELLATIEADYAKALRDDANNVAAFPQLPSDERIRSSLHAFRQRVSEPNVTQLVCAVCAERRFLDRFRIFLVAATRDFPTSSTSPPVLSESLLLAMKAKLVHDPAMPSHLPPLSGGKSGFLLVCALRSICFDHDSRRF